MTTAILIQARMGASRLPGKVLMDISGRPMVSHVVERCRQVKNCDDVMVVTTSESKDDPLAEYLQKNNIDFYRGSEKDVLDRYYQAAQKKKPNVIVRITSDCPLIDPDVTGRVIQTYLDQKDSLDYVSNFQKRTYPRGLDTEVFSLEALTRTWTEAKKTHEREHVTPYFYEQPGRFRIKNVANETDYSHLRWTVDEPSDLELARTLYKRLHQPGKLFSWKETLSLLEKEPDINLVNKDVRQKDVHAV